MKITRKIDSLKTYCPVCHRWIASRRVDIIPKHLDGDDWCGGSGTKAAYISRIKAANVSIEIEDDESEG